MCSWNSLGVIYIFTYALCTYLLKLINTNGELGPMTMVDINNYIYFRSKLELKQIYIQILSFYILF